MSSSNVNISRYTDPRFIVRMETPVCTEDQANSSIKQFISRAGISSVDWCINYGTKRDNTYDGYILLWIGGDHENARSLFCHLMNIDQNTGYKRSKMRPELEEAYNELYEREMSAVDENDWYDTTVKGEELNDLYHKKFTMPLDPTFELPFF